MAVSMLFWYLLNTLAGIFTKSPHFSQAEGQGWLQEARERVSGLRHAGQIGSTQWPLLAENL